MSATPNARAGRIRDELAPMAASLGLLVEDVEVMPAGKRRLVRVLVDRDLSGLDAADTTSVVEPVDLDLVADATRRIGKELDRSDAMGDQPYVLEVSSPGTDRPLTLPRHFRRNVRRLVRLTLDDGSTVAGRLTAADADGFAVAVDAPDGSTGERRIDYSRCARAHVQVEFSAAHGNDDMTKENKA